MMCNFGDKKKMQKDWNPSYFNIQTMAVSINIYETYDKLLHTGKYGFCTTNNKFRYHLFHMNYFS